MVKTLISSRMQLPSWLFLHIDTEILSRVTYCCKWTFKCWSMFTRCIFFLKNSRRIFFCTVLPGKLRTDFQFP
jgi:hypothetical protein